MKSASAEQTFSTFGRRTAKRAARPAALLTALLAVLLVLAGCATGIGDGLPVTPAERRAAENQDIIYLNLVWHQHQPLYYADPEDDVITRPWVRVHATKDYYDMAAILRDYPGIRASFNLTPVLLRQIDAYLAGAKDRYWVLSEKPADQLTVEEKRFILERFFDANWTNMVRANQRYGELLALRGDGSSGSIERALERFNEQDYRDLQVWFNLAWFDPDFLAEEPLRSLVAKGRNFSEADKPAIFGKTLEIMAAVVPLHRELQDSGQIEVLTTPYAHPILPLLYNTRLAEKGDPSSDMPARFSYPNDAIAHLRLSAERYRSDFGREPSGLWPAEGSVGQDIVRIVSEAGFSWMASGEQVLAKSVGIPGITRNARDVVDQADQLYRPYVVKDEKSGARMYIVFRDHRISDLVGFEYSGQPAERAARDFIDRIEAIRLRLKEENVAGPHLVTVILDGENAWEHYPNDGKEFLHAVYRNLSESTTIRTTTVSEYTAAYPQQREIEELWWGSWFSPDYATWIGEKEENTAWEYLLQVREDLARYDIAKRKSAAPEALAAALDAMYLAEGSDWFWWYGDDQDSGVDSYFDEAFRALLRKVYIALGEEVPKFVSIPIIPENPAPPVKIPSGTIAPLIDGRIGEDEWKEAGYFIRSGGTMARAEDVLEVLYYGWNREQFSLALVSKTAWDALPENASLVLYLSLPGQKQTISLTESGRFLGFAAGFKAVISTGAEGGIRAELYAVDNFGEWQSAGLVEPPGVLGRTLEFNLPFSLLPPLQPGDELMFKALLTDGTNDLSSMPYEGPGRALLPDLSDSRPLLAFYDPLGDDYGPGSYRYPTDAVFLPGVFDIRELTISENAENYLFTVALGAPVTNPWGSGIGLSLQTFDIYIDVDPGEGTGRRQLLEGRNAALLPGNGWEYAVWVEGWNQKLIEGFDDQSLAEVSGTPVRTLVDGPGGRVTIMVRKDALKLAGPADEWGLAVMVLSQDGFPSPGVRRVRDIQEAPSQWRFGGAAVPGEAVRIIDLALPQEIGVAQDEVLAARTVPLLLVQDPPGLSAADMK